MYVWTVNGSSLFRLHRDVEYWNTLKIALSDFWWKHVQPAKEICNRSVITNPLVELSSLRPAPKHELYRCIVNQRKVEQFKNTMKWDSYNGIRIISMCSE
ncbi:hypothetical protein Pfo_001681 [Paulownia fortunei]|nr:hypothetical protein Pfo_001681 [Paulownia fortunei]